MPVALFEHPAITVCRLAQNFPALLSPSQKRCCRCLAYQPVSQASTWPRPPGLRRHVCRIPRLDSSIGCCSRERGASPLRMAALRRDLVAQSRSRERPLTAHLAHSRAPRRRSPFRSHSRRSAGADPAGQFRPADCLRHPGLSARDGRKRRVPCGRLRAQVAFGLRTRQLQDKRLMHRDM
jgi:hypothetical protein